MTALDGLRVFDLSDSISGQFCSRMLADQGAQVCLVERPGGTRTRRMWPLHPQPPHESLLFANLNRSKQSITVDWHTASGRELLDKIIANAAVVIAGTDFTRGESATGYSVVTVSDFGRTGPMAHWRATELTHQALSGVMYETGKASKNPLYGCGYRSYHAAGVAAYICVVAELLAARRIDQRQDVTVDVAETAASMNYCRATQYNYSGIYDRRGGTKRPMAFLKCSDAWVCIFPLGARWKGVCEVLGAPELLDDPRYATALDRQRHWGEIIDVLETKVADRTAEEVVRAVQSRGSVASRAFSPSDLLTAEHLRARDFWRTYEGGTQRAVGPMFRMSRTPQKAPTAPPSLGEHNDEVYTGVGISIRESGALRHAGIM